MKVWVYWCLRLVAENETREQQCCFFPPPSPELPPSQLPVDFAIDSCGFGDAIPHFNATKKSNGPRLRVIIEESLITDRLCVCIVEAVGTLVLNQK